MSEIPRSERKTQNRVIQLFTGPGCRYLGKLLTGKTRLV